MQCKVTVPISRCCSSPFLLYYEDDVIEMHEDREIIGRRLAVHQEIAIVVIRLDIETHPRQISIN